MLTTHVSCSLVVVLIAFVGTTAAQQSPTVALKIVKKNGHCDGGANNADPCARDCDCPNGICAGDIAPTDFITGVAGDRFVLEVYASEWSPSPIPEKLRAWQAQLGEAALTSGLQGRLSFREGLRCCQPRLIPPFPPLDSTFECNDLILVHPVVCTNPSGIGFCNSTSVVPPRAAGSYLERYRTDYVFFALHELPLMDLSNEFLVRQGSVLPGAGDAVVYANLDSPKYLGTFVLEASDDACGTFNVELTSGGSNTSLLDPTNNLIVDPATGELNIEGVRIDLGSCEDCNENGIFDTIDLTSGTSKDCNVNGVPDECDIADGTSQDHFPRIWHGDGVPDECQTVPGEKK